MYKQYIVEQQCDGRWMVAVKEGFVKAGLGCFYYNLTLQEAINDAKAFNHGKEPEVVYNPYI